MSTAEPQYDPAIGGTVPPVTIDGTGLTTSIPITIKNAKAESGVELWYTGSGAAAVATGYGLMNASGALKGGIAIAAVANDWITGSAVDDIIIHGIVTKRLLFGVKGGAAPTAIIDLTNGKVGVGGAPVTGGGRLQVINSGAAEAQLFSDVLSICSYATSDVYIGARETTNDVEAALGTASGGGARARFGSLTNHRTEIFANNVERMSCLTTGDVVVGAGNTAQTALLTTATGGFLRLPGCPGPPTGAAVNGSIVIDTTNSKLYVRIGGAWVGGTVPGAFV